MSRFKQFHPGGLSVLLDPDIGKENSYHDIMLQALNNSSHELLAGKDATEAFYGLHRHEVLEQSQYQRLKIGTIAEEKSVVHGRVPGTISKVPYAEPTWLVEGYHSPYFSGVRAYIFSLQSPHPYCLALFLESPYISTTSSHVL